MNIRNESGIISCAVLLIHIIPYISDITLMYILEVSSYIIIYHCCLPTPMALASGASPIFPIVVHQPASPSIWPTVLFYVCCCECVGVCGNVCCVAAVVKYSGIFSLGV